MHSFSNPPPEHETSQWYPPSPAHRIPPASVEKYDEQMYRLLPNGEYVDNSSFKLNFEGKYTVKHVKLDEIEKNVETIPFGLSSKTKSILRNSLKIKNYIKVIYNKGLEKIQESL